MGTWSQSRDVAQGPGHLRSPGGIQATKQGVGMGEGTPEPDEGHSGEPWGQGPLQPEAGPHVLSSGLGTVWDSHQRAVGAGLPHFGGQDGGPQFCSPPKTPASGLPEGACQSQAGSVPPVLSPHSTPALSPPYMGGPPRPGGGTCASSSAISTPPHPRALTRPWHPTIALFSLRRSTDGLRLLQAPTRVNRTSRALQQGHTEARLPAALRGGQGGLWGHPRALTTKGWLPAGGAAGLPPGSRGPGSPQAWVRALGVRPPCLCCASSLLTTQHPWVGGPGRVGSPLSPREGTQQVGR